MPPFWLLQPWNPQRSQQSCPELNALGFLTGFYADFLGEAGGGGVGKKSLGFIFFAFQIPFPWCLQRREQKPEVKLCKVWQCWRGTCWPGSVCVPILFFFPLRYAVTLLLQAAACKFLDSCQPVQTLRFLPEEAAARYVRVRSREADPLDLLNSSR